MRSLPPWGMIGIGFALCLLSWAAGVLMLVKVIPASLWLSFLAWGAAVAGLFLGLIGASNYVVRNRKKRREDNPPRDPGEGPDGGAP